MYILQKNLTKYFREITVNQEVIIVDNVCNSMLFKCINEAEKFKDVLYNSYNYKFNVIEL
jgi:hypothetical protein